MEGLGGTRPLDLDLAMLRKAVSEVEIDEALVWNASLGGHALEVLNHILGEAHGYRLLELGRARILTRFHFRQIVFGKFVIFARNTTDKMNEKEIQSFSLATLLDICGRRPEDLYYDGCLIASRVNVKDEFNIDLFRYPTRLDAFAIIFCSKGSIVSTSGVTRHTIGERTLFVHLPGSILQVESVEDASVHAILCEKEFIQRINIDLKLLTQLFLQVEKHPSLPLDDEEWDEEDDDFELGGGLQLGGAPGMPGAAPAAGGAGPSLLDDDDRPAPPPGLPSSPGSFQLGGGGLRLDE